MHNGYLGRETLSLYKCLPLPSPPSSKCLARCHTGWNIPWVTWGQLCWLCPLSALQAPSASSLAEWGKRQKRPWWCASAAQQWPKYPWMIDTVSSTNLYQLLWRKLTLPSTHTQKTLTVLHKWQNLPQNQFYIWQSIWHCCDSRYLLDSEALQCLVYEAPPYSHELEPISELDHSSGWVGNGLTKHSNTFHGGLPFYSRSTNSVPYGGLAKGSRQMSGDIIVTMLTACEFVHQKVITLCSGKNLTFFAALRGWQQITITQFSKSTRWFAVLIKRHGSRPQIPNIRQNLQKQKKQEVTAAEKEINWRPSWQPCRLCVCTLRQNSWILQWCTAIWAKSAPTLREASFSAFKQRESLEHLNKHHKNTPSF